MRHGSAMACALHADRAKGSNHTFVREAVAGHWLAAIREKHSMEVETVRALVFLVEWMKERP